MTLTREELIAKIEHATAQLRHAYANLVGAPGMQGPPLSAEAAREFADGLIAPQIRRLESALAAMASSPSEQMGQCRYCSKWGPCPDHDALFPSGASSPSEEQELARERVRRVDAWVERVQRADPTFRPQSHEIVRLADSLRAVLNAQSSAPSASGPRARVGERQVKFAVVPLPLDEANAFVAEHHRHHGRVVGHKFSIGVADGTGEIRGVAIVSRPVARRLDDGLTLEITRVATDGCKDACSALYGACRRAAFALGYKRLVTYTLPSESGASLKAAGYRLIGEAGGGSNRGAMSIWRAVTDCSAGPQCDLLAARVPLSVDVSKCMGCRIIFTSLCAGETKPE